MISIRHMGLYVDDIEVLEDFYISVFDMTPICSKEPDKHELFDELLEDLTDTTIWTTKLITPYGKIQGTGDMLELVKVVHMDDSESRLQRNHPIYLTGTGHIAFGVDDMYKTVQRIFNRGGKQRTKIAEMKNGNLCCFCTDPEGNWIELIQRKAVYGKREE